MKLSGRISKMVATPTSPITYSLPLGSDLIPLNAYLGQNIKLSFSHEIFCMGCQKKITKSYQDGYCFPCTQKLARCDFCILKPERCHYHLGTCREPRWGESHCMVPHVVYLANTSGLKVGITRKTQIPTRWIDQGAIEALPIFEVSTRRVSGFVEVILAKLISDKTNWRKMLKEDAESVDLVMAQESLLKQIKKALQSVYIQFGHEAITEISDPQGIRFEYPILRYGQKIQSLSFDKTPVIEGELLGIKGQYLIFDQGVLNIRKHSGYIIEI